MIGTLKIPLVIEDFTGNPALHTPGNAGVVGRRTDVVPNRFYYALSGSGGAGVDLGEFGYAFIDTSDNTLAIRVSPSGYDAAPEPLGEEGVAVGVTAPFINTASNLWGFTLTCPAGFWALPWLLQAIQEVALQDPAGTGGVTVRDSLHVRPLDLAQGYTERAMFIYEVKPQAGAVTIDGQPWLPGGFTAQFRALNPEAVAAAVATVPGWSLTPLWGGSTGGAVDLTYTNGDLIAGKFFVDHDRGTYPSSVIVYNGGGFVETAAQYRNLSLNRFEVDHSNHLPIVGTYRVILGF